MLGVKNLQTLQCCHAEDSMKLSGFIDAHLYEICVENVHIM